MKGTFYGWYMKCQSASQTLAVIPAVHQSGKERTCSIQIITDHDAWNVAFQPEMFRKQGKNLWIGENQFSQNGLRLKIQIPFMECRHSVWSMRHKVNGTLYINDQIFHFQNARGYWEGDEGRSFPKQYAWTQCFFPGGSLMLSVADIPMAGIHFTGVIGAILWHGKEYRLATYLGAKAAQIRNGRIRIVQGDMELEVHLLERVKCLLKAPVAGDMKRTIREGASCRALYRFCKSGSPVFHFETDKASFEYEYP